MDLKGMQDNIKALGGDGWLFCDFQNRERVAYEILGLDITKKTTRRWFYLIPAQGEPIKLVHRIEASRLDKLPGKKELYSGWEELHQKLSIILNNVNCVFMQYSPMNNLPTISLVDAGTIELVKSFDVDVLSSSNLVQIFQSQLSEEAIEFHKRAGAKIHAIKDKAFSFIFDSLISGKTITEYDVQQFIVGEFENANLNCEGKHPIVAINEHASDPHFEPRMDNSYVIKKGDNILIDLWAKEKVEGGIYYDITWCGFAGDSPSEEYIKIFDIAVNARNKAKQLIIDRIKGSKSIYGWEVDKVCRDYITEQGYGKYFVHRTGHSIDTVLHGSGVNLDNLETKDDREIIPGTCFSIEPGIYTGKMGVRTEINVLVDHSGNVITTGDEQQELILMK